MAQVYHVFIMFALGITFIWQQSRYELEHKALLAEFSQIWESEYFRIPPLYHHCLWPNMPWSHVPKDEVVWKFCEKNSPDSMRARTNIMYPAELGRGKFVRQCYERGSIIAQKQVATLMSNDSMCQVILLIAEGKVITGYTLWAPRGTRVITDAFAHGPLIWGD